MGIFKKDHHTGCAMFIALRLTRRRSVGHGYHTEPSAYGDGGLALSTDKVLAVTAWFAFYTSEYAAIPINKAIDTSVSTDNAVEMYSPCPVTSAKSGIINGAGRL